MDMTTRLDDRCNALLVIAGIAAAMLTGPLTEQFDAEIAAADAGTAAETVVAASEIQTLPTVSIIAQR